MDLLIEIKKSKKYKDIADEIILKEIKRGGDVKDIKSRLHNLVSRFRTTKKNKAWKLLKELRTYKTNNEIDEVIEKLLCTNRSTKERVRDYKKLYSKIFSIIGNLKTIADLGCGLNGISYGYFGYNPEYKGYDVDFEEAKICNEFFKTMKAKAKYEILDCSEVKNLKKIKADIVFMFKFLDPIEGVYGKGHKLAEELIGRLDCRWVVISFATKTLSGRDMRFAHRGWIERMLERVGYRYDVIEIDNEIFYVIGKT